MDRNSINKARMVYYRMFASLFAFKINGYHYENILNSIDLLKTNPVNKHTGRALELMKKELEGVGFEGLKDESDRVIFSPTTTYVPVTASYYAEERDDGRKRAEMMNLILQSKFRKNSEEYKENEDHIEFISLFMCELIRDELDGENRSGCLAKIIFANILNEMMEKMSERLFVHEHGKIYKQAGILLRSFADIERLFFNVSKPVLEATENLAKPNIKLRKEKKPQREMVKRNMDEFVSV